MNISSNLLYKQTLRALSNSDLQNTDKKVIKSALRLYSDSCINYRRGLPYEKPVNIAAPPNSLMSHDTIKFNKNIPFLWDHETFDRWNRCIEERRKCIFVKILCGSSVKICTRAAFRILLIIL
jgi:hypothetical protein